MEHSQKEFIFTQIDTVKGVNVNVKDLKEIYRNGPQIHELNDISTLKQRTSIKPGLYTLKNVAVKEYEGSLNDQALREYIIGCKTVNTLSSIVPYFVKTLGLISYDTKIGIVYPKIKGISLSELLKEGMGFSSWIRIFFQLMIGLEIAQRKVSFTHYDLHVDNVMVIDGTTEGHTILLDDTIYTVKSTPLPVIIDFGTTSVSIDGRYIGSYDYTNSGIFYFVVPGHDMFRLIVSSYCSADNSSTRKGILKLFEFFSSCEPYCSPNYGKSEGIKKANKDFCSRLVTSKAASLTPMMMISYIRKEFGELLLPCISINPRRIRAVLVKIKHSDIIGKTINRLLLSNGSYILISYLLYISPDQTLRNRLDSEKQKYIENDNTMLNRVFDIVLPDKTTLITTREMLINLPLRHRNASVKEKVGDEFNDLTTYQRQIDPYILALYTLIELNLEVVYSEWIHNFNKSDILTFYRENKVQNDRAYRWARTLLASIIF